MKAPKYREAAEVRRRARAGKLFLLPFIIGFICFYVQPLLMSLYYTFVNVQPKPGGGLTVGVGDNFFDKLTLDNYRYMFDQETDFWQNLLGTFKNMAMTAPVIRLVSLLCIVRLTSLSFVLKLLLWMEIDSNLMARFLILR